MEDACVANCSGGQGDWANIGIFGVFDGHGGAQVAKFCAEQFPKVVRQGDASKLSATLRNSFLQVDEMLADLGRTMAISEPGHPDHVGCTAVVSLVSEDTIIVANAGDSRAILGRNGRAVALSHDHKPNVPKEAARIQKAGGFVAERHCGPNDVIHRVNGKLSLSRSMGDFSYKKNDALTAADQIVSCVPEIKSFRRQRDDEFVVIACDGVWDVMTSQQVVDRVQKYLLPIRCGNLSSDAVVSKILDECIASDPSKSFGKGTDNLTMILIVFHKDTGLPVAPCKLFNACLDPAIAPGQSAARFPRRNVIKDIMSDEQEASPYGAFAKPAETTSAEKISSTGNPFTVQ